MAKAKAKRTTRRRGLSKSGIAFLKECARSHMTQRMFNASVKIARRFK